MSYLSKEAPNTVSKRTAAPQLALMPLSQIVWAALRKHEVLKTEKSGCQGA
jgi:hypothetical protein